MSQALSFNQIRAEVARLAGHLDAAEASMAKLRSFLG
jgi:hypothetical protein